MTDERVARTGRRLTATVTDLEVERQRALLIGVAVRGADLDLAETSLAELALLTDTAGSDPVEAKLGSAGIETLDDETADHAMKQQAVKDTPPRQTQEALDVARSLRCQELDDDGAAVGL